jgi:hypothetical protein
MKQQAKDLEKCRHQTKDDDMSAIQKMMRAKALKKALSVGGV